MVFRRQRQTKELDESPEVTNMPVPVCKCVSMKCPDHPL